MTDKQKKIAMNRQKGAVRCQGCGEILPQEGSLRNRICENEKEL